MMIPTDVVLRKGKPPQADMQMGFITFVACLLAGVWMSELLLIALSYRASVRAEEAGTSD